jgi:predicted RNase H-like nuclease (RuvC/YqgF family)
MRSQKLRSCCAVFYVCFGMQSLVDIANQEAERRRLIDQQGIETRVIEGNTVPSDSNVAEWTDPPEATPKTSKKSDSTQDKTSARSFRTALQKLDRAIRANKDLMEAKRARLQSERWASPKSGRSASKGQTSDAQSKLKAEIEELQAKMKELRRERSEIYEEGKKAGFLPGELNGHGITH